MTEQNQSITHKLKQGLSRTVMLVGAAGFWIGDRFLHEIMHVNAVASEVIGIGGGILLVLVGGATSDRRKPAKSEQRDHLDAP